MLIWITAILLAVLFGLVAVQRVRARRWHFQHFVGTRGDGSAEFRGVWLTKTPPQASLGATRQRETGSLSIDYSLGRAVFARRSGGELLLTGVNAVAMGRAGSDFVNTWIEVHADGQPSPVYLNDGRWLGWHALLTRSNERMASALAVLIPEAS